MFPFSLYLLAFPALLVLLVTAVVRGNDIGKVPYEQIDSHPHGKFFWAVRKFALILIAGASAGWLLEPWWLWHARYLYYFCGYALLFGFMLDWLTSPGMPPWWRLITGYFDRYDHAAT